MLRTLKSQRTRLRQKITTELNAAQILAEAGSGDGSQSNLKASLSLLTDFQNRFEALSFRIAEKMEGQSDEEIDREGEQAMDTITDISHVTTQLSGLIQQDNQRSHPEASELQSVPQSSEGMANLQAQMNRLIELQTLKLSTNGTASPIMQQPFEEHRHRSVRLPQLEFQKFSGDVLHFQEFWDSFSAAIDSNPTLQSVEKFGYLKASLIGEAKQAISGVSISDANYDVAVRIIKQRYGNPQASIDAHYSQLTNLQSIPNFTPRLRSLFDDIEKHLRCLSALGEDVNHRHFISLMMSKMPREVVVRLEESKDDAEAWTVELLRKKLQNQLNAREAAERQQAGNRSATSCVPSGPSDRRSFPSKSRWFTKDAPRLTAESLVAGDRFTAKDMKCSLCSGNHFSDQCLRFQTIEQRRRRLNGRCFICLRTGHLAPECHSTKACFYCRKVKKHHRCLCPTKFSGSAETSAVTMEDSRGAPDSDTAVDTASSVPHHAVLSSGDRVLLQTATVNVQRVDGNTCISTRVLLDCASNRSYISSSLAEELQVKPCGAETFSVVTFGSEKPKTVETKVAKIQLYLKDGSTKILDVNIVPKITGAIHRAPVNFKRSSFLWKDLPLADTLPSASEASAVDFLIGNDYYLDLVTAEKIEIGSGLYLLGSHLGWLLTGRVEGEKNHSTNVSMFVSSLMNSSIPELSLFVPVDQSFPVKPSFEDFWKLESIGITDNPDVIDDDRAISQFNATVKMSAGRYEVTWPWKEACPDLPENYQLSLGRFKSLLRKFQSDPNLLSKYAEIIKDQEEKGVIEKVTADTEDSPYKHYVPHHPVVNMAKSTTKVRIVYDASAKARKDAKSLNECLLRGPIILEDLCGMLLRFRMTPVVIIADIEKAFLQVGLQKPDRDVTRFLWLKDPTRPSFEQNLQPYRFCRVPFGVVSSPFLLSATVRYHLQKTDTPVAKKIRDNLYVDNVITGVETSKEAVCLYEEAKNIFQCASMNLREWNSNSIDFLNHIPDCDKVKERNTKVLGLHWDSINDRVSVASPPYYKRRTASTKREILQDLAAIFDPLGLFAPLTVKAKFFVHQLWNKGLNWDDKVEKTHEEEWQGIVSELAKIGSHSVDRFIGIPHKEPVTVQLLAFCDASALAYSAAVYVKVSTATCSKVNLVFAKTRLPPSKQTTMPRLELLAVVIGVRCLEFVQRQLRVPVKDKILWTDSQCVLHWMKSKKPLPVFIKNRLREIKKCPEMSFRYVNTSENPVDIATRGQASYDDVNSSFWWGGPPWLSQSEDRWPTWSNDVSSNACPDEDFSSSSSRLYEVGLLLHQVKSSSPYNIDVDNFSSLTRLYRVTAWITRFIKRSRKQSTACGCLSSSEIRQSKHMWDRFIQQLFFPEVCEAIKSKEKCNLKEQLNIHTDEEGILRCHGRFLNAPLFQDVKYPKVLPKQCHYTELVIRSHHERLLHSGVGHTLSQIRREYWIPQGRSVVRKSIARCIICRRCDGGPYRIPLMPPWPLSRVSRSSPFSYTGLDYIGPLYVKIASGDTQKVWVCLFTCLAVRAVHLEIVQDMSAQQFLMCLRRFIARRGTPIQIISDNAAQFKLSNCVLERAWGQVLSDPDIKDYISSRSISWKFIPEKAPWMGGFYERLVGSVKRALKTTQSDDSAYPQNSWSLSSPRLKPCLIPDP